ELGEMFGLDPEIARALNDMVGSVLDIVDAMDAVTKATNSAADAIGDVGTSMGQTGSAVLAVFGAIISISSAIMKIDMALQQAKMDERVARINDELERVKRLVDDIGASMGEGWFVTDNFEKVKNLNAELTTLASHAAVAMKKWVNSWADTFTSGEYMRQAVKDMFADVTNLANQLNSDAFDSAFSGQMLGNIDALNDALGKMEELANVGTDAEKAMAEAAIELLEQAIGTYDELRSTISAMVGDISGTLYNTVTVEWKKIWMENRDAGAESFAGIADAAKKNIADIMETLVTQQIWASVMAPVFDQLGTNLTNAIVGGGDITGVFDQFFAGFDAQLEGYYGALDQFYTDAEARGWKFSNPNETATSGTTSQEDALDKLVEKQKLLNDLYKQWIDLYGQETADAMLAGMGAD
ncbi:MAG TPA: hypothetical protein PKI59_07895, partial [Candidatus Cloacimonadota bacterium]|nr:hypothetical protein [Candidatus Cloacimonadota bacterium]